MIDTIKEKYRRRRDYVQVVLKGFCMGVADIIPGISGGTIALLLGIYEELIFSIKSFDLKFLQLLGRFRIREAFSSVAWQFLGAVLIGIAGAVFSLSKLIIWFFHHKPIFIHSFFFGLILATVLVIARIIQKWTWSKIVTVILMTAATYFFVGMVPVKTPETLWFLFLCGAVAISAMILPGISGAFILVLLGKYQFILNAVDQLDFFKLSIFCLGIIAGIVVFVRVLGWLFSRYHDFTVAIITGVVLGSLRKIWPWKETIKSITTSHGKVIPVAEINILPAQLDGAVVQALLIMIFGFILALMLNSSPDKKLLS